MTEPCDLNAVTARRLIGQKKLAPTELLASCIARIEAVDHAVNAMVARDLTEPAPLPKSPMPRWRGATACPRCTACRSA